MTDKPLKLVVPADHPYRKDSDFRWVLDDPAFWRVEESIAALSGVRYEDMDEPTRRLARKRYAFARMYGMAAQMMDNRLKDGTIDFSPAPRVRISPNRRAPGSPAQDAESNKEK